MSTQSLWHPQQINANLMSRAAVSSRKLTWYQGSYLSPYSQNKPSVLSSETLAEHEASLAGIWFACFESDDEVQEHPVTMLTRFDPGGFFPLHAHPGGEEILVLQGNFIDETGIHPPGTYMLNPEGFIHRPYSEEGCLTFVKLRQHGGKTRQQIRTNIFEASWQPGITPEIEVQLIYQQMGYLEKVWVERWQPGTMLSDVVETEIKEIFVVEGTWSDELGSYLSGSWLRYPPNCPYSPFSETGCLIYVKTYPPVPKTSRFVVAEDFRYPFEQKC